MTSDEQYDLRDDIRLVWRELRRLRKSVEWLLLMNGVVFGLGIGASVFYLITRGFF
jgi:hypothetical protein